MQRNEAAPDEGSVEAKLRRLEPRPPIEFTCSHFEASADGSYAVLAGLSNEVQPHSAITAVQCESLTCGTLAIDFVPS